MHSPIRYVWTFGSAVALREDPPKDGDGDEGKKKGDETPLGMAEVNKAITSHTTRMMTKVTDLITEKVSGLASKDDIADLIKATQGDDGGGGDETPPADPPGDKEKGSDEIPESLRVRFDSMDTRIKKAEDENKTLKADLDKERSQQVTSSRNNHVLEVLRKNNVKNPDHLLRFFEKDLVMVDGKNGGAQEVHVPVDTDYGPSTKAISDYIPEFLKENPEYVTRTKSGTGGGGDSGTPSEGTGTITEAELDPDYYAKNQEEMRKKFDKARGIK